MIAGQNRSGALGYASAHGPTIAGAEASVFAETAPAMPHRGGLLTEVMVAVRGVWRDGSVEALSRRHAANPKHVSTKLVLLQMPWNSATPAYASSSADLARTEIVDTIIPRFGRPFSRHYSRLERKGHGRAQIMTFVRPVDGHGAVMQFALHGDR